MREESSVGGTEEGSPVLLTSQGRNKSDGGGSPKRKGWGGGQELASVCGRDQGVGCRSENENMVGGGGGEKEVN